mgnify:CR=1 FL=1
MKTILPLGYSECKPDAPVFFLAGPVQGASDWHTVFCKEIQKQMGTQDFYVAIPKRYRKDPDGFVKQNQDKPTAFWDTQNAWERHYMEIASKSGCLIFWLPVEDEGCPRDDGCPYAMTTRGEIGEWRGRYMHDRSIKIVVGADNRFKGLRTIHENFLAIDYNFPIYESIKETIAAAILSIQKVN